MVCLEQRKRTKERKSSRCLPVEMIRTKKNTSLVAVDLSKKILLLVVMARRDVAVFTDEEHVCRQLHHGGKRTGNVICQ